MEAPKWRFQTDKVRDIVAQCLGDAAKYIEHPETQEAIRHQKLLKFQNGAGDIPGLEQWARELHQLFDGVAATDAVVKDVLRNADNDLQALKTLPQPPADDESKEYKTWDATNGKGYWAAFDKVTANMPVLVAQSKKSCPIYARQLDIQKILKEITGPYVEDKLKAVLFRSDGKEDIPVAITAYEVNEATKEVIIYELTITPKYNQMSGTGAGSVMVEWLARKVPSPGNKISLLSLSEDSSKVYTYWGFVGTAAAMQLSGDNMVKFLGKYKMFEKK